MTPEVHRLADQLERAIDAGDVHRVLVLIDAARLRRKERLQVCELLSRKDGPVVVIVFDRNDEGRILTAA